MTKQLTAKAVLLPLILLLLTGSVAAGAQGGKTIVGKVRSFDRETLAVKTDASQTVTFVLGPETQYVKWVTQKPLQRSTVADWTFLGVGNEWPSNRRAESDPHWPGSCASPPSDG